MSIDSPSAQSPKNYKLTELWILKVQYKSLKTSDQQTLASSLKAEWM